MLFCCDRYEWRRDGTRRTFPLAGDGSGTIIITEPERQHEGVYQCFAQNGVGKAMSNTTTVVRAERAQFPEDPVRSEPATVGKKLRINCRSTQHGVPSPTIRQYAWRSADNDNQWPLDQRVQIDDDGMRMITIKAELCTGRAVIMSRRLSVCVSLCLSHAGMRQNETSYDHNPNPVQHQDSSFCRVGADRPTDRRLKTDDRPTTVAVIGQFSCNHQSIFDRQLVCFDR